MATKPKASASVLQHRIIDYTATRDEVVKYLDNLSADGWTPIVLRVDVSSGLLNSLYTISGYATKPKE